VKAIVKNFRYFNLSQRLDPKTKNIIYEKIKRKSIGKTMALDMGLIRRHEKCPQKLRNCFAYVIFSFLLS